MIGAVVAGCTLVIGVGFIFQRAMKDDVFGTTSQSGVPSNPRELGQQGSICGGPERYPCIPGTLCTVPTGAAYGTCTLDPAGRAPATPPNRQ